MKITRWTIAAIVLLSAATSAPSSAQVESHEIIGSWKLVSYEYRDATGAAVYPFGRSPAGILTYTAGGHMAVQIMNTPPPDVASDDWSLLTNEEKLALFDGYAAYFRRFEVDTIRGVVVHLPDADLSRTYIGKREERRFVIDGDRLTLSEAWIQGGSEWSGVRVFERLR